MTSQRGRGRPKGDGVNDDRTLMAIAVKLVSGQAQDYEEAAAAVYLTHKPAGSHVRKTVMDRWRGKWHQRSAVFLEQARRLVVRVVGSPPNRRFPMSHTVTQQHVQHYKPLLSAGRRHVSVTTEQFHSQQAEMLERVNGDLVRPAFERLPNGEVCLTFGLRKHQS